MMTRKEYMEDSSKRHDAYYGQFVTAGISELVSQSIGRGRIAEAIEIDPVLNNIPLHEWDALANNRLRHDASLREQLKAAGDFYSLGNGVCILKAAARQLVERENSKS